MVPSCFEQFVQRSPLSVMARASIERLFNPKRLDELFEKHSKIQYQRELLFSHLIELLLGVIIGSKNSLRAAYIDDVNDGKLKVSIQALYGKLRRTELGLPEALVNDSAVQLSEVMAEWNAERPALLPGYRTMVVDGNRLSKTERRVGPLRTEWSCGLPGRALVVYDYQSDLVTNVFLEADGHASERSRMADVMALAKPGQVWLADANFSVISLMNEWIEVDSCFVVRQHKNCEGKPISERQSCGRAENGEVFEQSLQLKSKKGVEVQVRLITLVLDQPTRDGLKNLCVLSNLPAEVSACQIAALYRNRWSIENRFFEMSQTLSAEPKSLGYPPAALLAFCLGLMASNAAALMRCALRANHELEDVEQMSRKQMADQIQKTMTGMLIAIPEKNWLEIAMMSTKEWAAWYKEIASHVKVKWFRKSSRGPKKPQPPKKPHRPGNNVSTKRLLDKRKEEKERNKKNNTKSTQ
jgi:hypothetical protein